MLRVPKVSRASSGIKVLHDEHRAKNRKQQFFVHGPTTRGSRGSEGSSGLDLQAQFSVPECLRRESEKRKVTV